KAARELAATQRAAVPLLGHDVAVAEALLGAATRRADGIAEIDLDARTRVFLVFDRAGACTGVYAVGRDGLRSIEAAAAAVLSQAVGKPSPITKPASADDSARWYAAGWPVVARRASGDVVELRVGDAAP
ncbi:MAG TPA: hypothetical protein VFP84_13670, partial [Kofleriaceae bacterium]|nr:hypothetical protein [Kofleriaceae bacterium]